MNTEVKHIEENSQMKKKKKREREREVTAS